MPAAIPYAAKKLFLAPATLDLSASAAQEHRDARDAMLANAPTMLKDEARIAKCVEAKGRPPMRRSNQRAFASGAGLGFHIYVQVYT